VGLSDSITQRLYYTDSYLKDFRASVVERSPDGRLYLDRTAFYPASGGQPGDRGAIAGVPVLEVIDEGERVAHLTGAPVGDAEVACRIDWTRRFDHMQQHTGQHLLSAVLVELYGAQTVGFHLGAASSTIDVAAGTLSEEQIEEAERRANEIACENRPVSVSFEDTGQVPGLRRPSEREGKLRIVSIEGLDRSACGGTHVRATGEIGPILIRKLDRAHGNLRIEFLCGLRAVGRARADYDALSEIARTLSVALDDAPGQAAAQAKLLETAEKARRKLALELAAMRGRELYQAAAPNAAGLRCHVQRIGKGTLDEELRALAGGFAAGARACFLAVVEEPPSVLLAVSKDAGLNAGDLVKQAVAALGGRGGGSAQMAQGGVPSRQALEQLAAELTGAAGQPPLADSL
jgi:alanyl-tRNA synthetase